MALPESFMVEPREVASWIRERFGCTGDKADSYLRDWWKAGLLTIEWDGEPPPVRPRFEDLNWSEGKYAERDKVLPGHVLDDFTDRKQEWSRLPGRVWYFAIRRQTLEEAAAIAAKGCKPDRPKAHSGRPEAPYWAEIKLRAMDWLDDEGAPERGDGRQAVLEKFVLDLLTGMKIDPLPGESTVRRHIDSWIEDFKETRRNL